MKPRAYSTAAYLFHMDPPPLMRPSHPHPLSHTTHLWVPRGAAQAVPCGQAIPAQQPLLAKGLQLTKGTP